MNPFMPRHRWRGVLYPIFKLWQQRQCILGWSVYKWTLLKWIGHWRQWTFWVTPHRGYPSQYQWTFLRLVSHWRQWAITQINGCVIELVTFCNVRVVADKVCIKLVSGSIYLTADFDRCRFWSFVKGQQYFAPWWI